MNETLLSGASGLAFSQNPLDFHLFCHRSPRCAFALFYAHRITARQWRNSNRRRNQKPRWVLKAVIFTSDGGGTWSPYCIVSVSLVPALLPDASARGRDKTIFASGCGGTDMNWRRKWTDFVSWKSPADLQITFDPKAGAEGVSRLTQARSGAGGKVAISYAFIDEKARYDKWMEPVLNSVRQRQAE